MKYKLKYSHIFYITLAILIINLIPVIYFRKSFVLSQYALPPIIVMSLVIVNGILSCVFKHKGNFLIIRKHHSFIFSSDKDYTFAEEYERNFRRMLLVYCTAIPFYLPVAFFASNWSQTLWTLLVLLVPQAIFIIHNIYETIHDVKKEKILQERLRKEKIEQERREELGHWK